MKSILHNHRGFSLMEIMIAMGLMVAASAAFMTMMTNQNKSLKTAEINSELNEVNNVVRQTLADQDACEATFIGLSSGANVSEIRLSHDLRVEPFMKVGEVFQKYKVNIKEMRLLSREEEIERNIIHGEVRPSDGRGTATLEVTYSKVADGGPKNFLGGSEIKKFFNITAFFAEYNLIAGCTKPDVEKQCDDRATAAGITTGKYMEYLPGGPHSVEGCPVEGFILDCRLYKNTFPITGCAE